MEVELALPSHRQQITATQSQVQKHVLSQRLIQSIGLMALPLTELREVIRDEVEKNPALEIAQDADSFASLDLNEKFLQEEQFTDSDPFANSSDPGHQTPLKGDPDLKQNFLEGAIFRTESLTDHLMAQLNLSACNDSLFSLIENLIGNLDSNGFHIEEPQCLLKESQQGLLDEALKILQAFDPIGCACKDWTESLITQASIRGDAPDELELFIKQALPMLEHQEPKEVYRKLNISPDDWEDLYNYIQILNPFPGRIYTSDSTSYLVPDIVVHKVENELQIVLNDEVLPVLRVDPEFEKIAANLGENKKIKRFVSDYTQKAHYFINSLAQRDNTLFKVAWAIVEFQRDFFSGGPRQLKPLTLKDIAHEIGVHEATVSRITSNKYAQTDWGVFELKYFFSNSISGAGSSGSQVSKVAAKETIREILSEIGSGQRISDQKMSELLARRGITIARRTVAKYRKELDLPSSYGR